LFSEPPQDIDSELELARLLTARFNIGSGKCYFCVNRIAKDLNVSPDIDLLRVYINEYRPEESTTTGFELKVLKPRKYAGDHWRINLDPFYQGLGQVLTYFEHGVDRAALVVGFHRDCSQHPDEAEDAERLLKAHCAFLQATAFMHLPYLEIYSLRDGELEKLVHSSNWEKARFPHMSDDGKLRRDAILHKQFVFKRSW